MVEKKILSKLRIFLDENCVNIVVKYLKVIFKRDLSYLLSLVFVSLSLVFVNVLFSCFDL